MPASSIILQIISIAIIGLLLLQATVWLLASMRQSVAQRKQQELNLKLLEEKFSITRLKYSKASEEKQAWQGFRKFIVARAVREATDIHSVYLVPHDRIPLPGFRARPAHHPENRHSG